MATKPTDTFTCATDANFASGDAVGQPTKVSPPGFPACAQGIGIPGEPAAPEFINKLFNICGQWVDGWVLQGSSAGAANAHIVETNASGNTAVRDLTLTSATCASGISALVGSVTLQLYAVRTTIVNGTASPTTMVTIPIADQTMLHLRVTLASFCTTTPFDRIMQSKDFIATRTGGTTYTILDDDGPAAEDSTGSEDIVQDLSVTGAGGNLSVKVTHSSGSGASTFTTVKVEVINGGTLP